MKINKPSSKQPIPKNAKKVFGGIIFDVYQWQQKLFNGKFTTFEKLRRPDTVIIIAITDDKKIILVDEQQPGKAFFVGNPGGRVDEGEDVIKAAERELLEETGYKAKEIKLWFATNPHMKIDWTIYFLIAKDCKKVADMHLDGGEKIKLKFVTFDKFIDFGADGKLEGREMQIEFLQAKLDEKKMIKLKKLFLG